MVAEHLAHSSSRWCRSASSWPAANGENGHASSAGQGMLGMLINLLVAEKSGFQPSEAGGLASLARSSPTG